MTRNTVRYALLVALVLPALAALSAPAANAQGATVPMAFAAATPKYNRPTPAQPPTALSGFANSVPYITVPFNVSVTGSYNLLFSASLNNGTGNLNYGDTVLTIYQNAFNPQTPLTNALTTIDIFGADGAAGSSGFTLSSGVQYFFVGTTFNNGTYTGNSTVSIGNVTRPAGSLVTVTLPVVVPEAGTLALLLPALGVGVIARRRRAA